MSRRRTRAAWAACAAVSASAAVLAAGVLAAAAVAGLAGGGRRPARTLRRAAPPGLLAAVQPVPILHGVQLPGGAAPQTVVASVGGGRGVAIPRSYLGLSIETWDLLRFDSRPAVFARVLRLLAARGDGPVVLRLGGDSADRTVWHAPPPDRGDQIRYLSRIQYRLTRRWFSALRSLTLAAQLKLLLDLNLAVGEPAMASAFAHEARAVLPAGSIAAFEIGNEPDLYHRRWFYEVASAADSPAAPLLRWKTYSAGLYVNEFARYARALAGIVRPPTLVRLALRGTTAVRVAQTPPRIPLAGPEVADAAYDLGYMRRLLATHRRQLGMLTGHRYPYAACSTPNKPGWPTIARLLSPAATTGLAAGIEPAVRLAASAGLPFRLTELNSVTCGGLPGVSDTFATALWAPDVLFALLHAGVAGVNIHVRENKDNQAFAITQRGLFARPLLYGMLAFARALDGARTLLPVRIGDPGLDNVSVWAVRTALGGVHVLALDKGPSAVTLTLRLPASAAATVERLTAPSVSAKHGIRLAGQWLDATGRWVGQRVVSPLAPGAHGYELRLPPYSGALLAVPAAAAPEGG